MLCHLVGVFEKQSEQGSTHTSNCMSNPLVQGQLFHHLLKHKHKQKTPLGLEESVDKHTGTPLQSVPAPACFLAACEVQQSLPCRASVLGDPQP